VTTCAPLTFAAILLAYHRSKKRFPRIAVVCSKSAYDLLWLPRGSTRSWFCHGSQLCTVLTRPRSRHLIAFVLVGDYRTCQRSTLEHGQPQQRSLAARKKWARLALPNSLGKLLTLRPPAGERLQILTTSPTAEPRQNEYSSTTEEKSEVNLRFNGHGFIDSGLRFSARSHNPSCPSAGKK
jgi:hypothetical protein